jgi:hypothetical protein
MSFGTFYLAGIIAYISVFTIKYGFNLTRVEHARYRLKSSKTLNFIAILGKHAAIENFLISCKQSAIHPQERKSSKCSVQVFVLKNRLKHHS